MMSDVERQNFQDTVWSYYRAHGRHDLPWRQVDQEGQFDPYKIMVSELMLQQTQVGRVIPKYRAFLDQYPTVRALASTPLGDELRAWNGLGYNRRAKYLHAIAQQIVQEHDGQFSDEVSELVKLPGIGPNTAGAIRVYAYDKPSVFLETNVRTVYIHHFLHDQTDIPDTAIRNYVAETLDLEHPREWYWALVDYGSHLKRTVGNLNRHSASYAKQSAFEGSLRQIRGQVIRTLGAGPQTAAQLRRTINDERLDIVLDALLREALIKEQKGKLSL